MQISWALCGKHHLTLLLLKAIIIPVIAIKSKPIARITPTYEVTISQLCTPIKTSLVPFSYTPAFLQSKHIPVIAVIIKNGEKHTHIMR